LPVPLEQKIPNVDPLALRLLQRLLAFDPKDQPTVEDRAPNNEYSWWWASHSRTVEQSSLNEWNKTFKILNSLSLRMFQSTMVDLMLKNFTIVTLFSTLVIAYYRSDSEVFGKYISPSSLELKLEKPFWNPC
ncbi:hypothetical protein ES319_A04G068500v1, partial [Gossypium barbadense]